MKKITNKTFFTMIVLVVALMLALSACGSGAASSPTSPTSSSSSSSAASGTCFIGTWNLTDFSSYIDSLKSSMETGGASVSITTQPFTGNDQFVYSSDGTAKFTANKFEQKFTITRTANGKTSVIPVSLDVNGTSTSKYSVSGDELSFSDQNESGLKTTITAMGNTITATTSLMGKAGTVEVYQFSCPDANTLSIKAVATNKADYAPITLTRAN